MKQTNKLIISKDPTKMLYQVGSKNPQNESAPALGLQIPPLYVSKQMKGL